MLWCCMSISKAELLRISWTKKCLVYVQSLFGIGEGILRIWRWEISQISTLFRKCSSFRTLFWVCEDWSNFFVFTFFNLFSVILNWNTKLLLKGVNFLCSSWFYFYVFYFIGLINYNNKNFDVQVFCLIFLFQSFSKI